MSKSWRYTLITLSLAVLALIFWQSPPAEIQDLLNTETPKETNYPSAYLSNTHTTQYNEQGQIDYEINSEEIRFFDSAEQSYSEYREPFIRLYNDGSSQPIEISSRKGWSDDDGKEVRLEDEVLIIQTLANGTHYTLSTDALTLLPDEQFAQTDKPVIITEPSGITTATGLKAYFAKERLELLSKVRGSYAQP